MPYYDPPQLESNHLDPTQLDKTIWALTAGRSLDQTDYTPPMLDPSLDSCTQPNWNQIILHP